MPIVLDGSNGITAPGGTAAAPSITTVGDTNTGIFFPAADTIAFSEGGVEAARFNSIGDFLVGGTAVLSPAINSTEISINNPRTSSSGGSVIAFGIQGSRAGYVYADVSSNIEVNSSTGYVQLSTVGGLARFTSGGNFGIGTGSPATKLDVNGDVTQRNGSGTIIGNIQNSSGWYDFKGSANVNGAQISTAAATPIRFLPNGVEAGRFDSSGNLGIGTANPGTFGKFASVAASGATSVYTGTGVQGLYITTNESTRVVRYDSSGSLTGLHAWGNGPSELMRLDSSGNLGIGTASPTQKLEVAGSGNAFVSNGQAIVSAGSGITYSARLSCAYNFPFVDTYLDSVAGASYSGQIIFRTSSGGGAMTERMRLDSSGNLGIGTTSPAGRLDIRASGAVQQYIISTSATSQENVIVSLANNGTVYSSMNFDSADYKFKTSGTERARITSGGDLLVGTTSATSRTGVTAKIVSSAVSSQDAISAQINSNAYFTLCSHVTTTSGTRYHIGFGDGTTWAERGTISTDGTSTSYNTSSDYRLKNTIAPMTGALEKVALLKPCTYKWNADGSDGQGFIAHELAEIVPQCVTGEKDAVDAEGKPQYQGVDTSFLVATLTAAIQELTARVAALEGNN